MRAGFLPHPEPLQVKQCAKDVCRVTSNSSSPAVKQKVLQIQSRPGLPGSTCALLDDRVKESSSVLTAVV